MVLFWRGWRYTVDILYHLCASTLYCGGDRFPMFYIKSTEENIETAPCIEVAGWLYPIPICFERDCLCQKRYPFWHHHCAGNILPYCSLEISPFNSFLMSRARNSVGLHVPIIFTTLSYRSNSTIAPYELKMCWRICRAATCPNPSSWSIIGDRNTGCTSVEIWFLIDQSMEVYLTNSAWFCWNLSVLSACAWTVPIVGG